MTARVWAATAVRLGLAAVLAWAAVSKIGDPAAAVRAVRAYRLLPETLAEGVGYGLPFLELSLAALLLVGLATRTAAALTAALFAVFLAGIVSADARGLRIECGCFGGGGELPAGQSAGYAGGIARDAVLLLLAAGLAVWPRTRYALEDRLRRSVAGVPEARPGRRRTAEARRREAELVAQRAAAGRRRGRLAGVLGVVLLVLATGVGIGVQAARAGGGGGPAPQAVSVADGVVVGRDSARVTIDVYEDPQCPNCAAFERQAGGQLDLWQRTGTARLRYYVVAFLDKQSTTDYSSRAAGAAYCAADAGVFPRYHDLLYANQPAEGSEGLSDDALLAIGARAGLGEEQLVEFRRCLAGRTYGNFVSEITEQASRDGVVGTPTVLVGGKPVEPTLSALNAAVGAAT